jgi:hypothetical protein
MNRMRRMKSEFSLGLSDEIRLIRFIRGRLLSLCGQWKRPRFAVNRGRAARREAPIKNGHGCVPAAALFP